MQRSTRFSGITFCIHAVLFLCQLFPLVIQFLLVEAGIIQFITLIPQKQVVAQNLRVVDLVFQLNNMGAKLFDLGFQRFQAGAHLGTAAALLLAIACLLGLILLLGGFRLFGSIAVMQLLEVLVESRLAIFQLKDASALQYQFV